MAEDFDLNALSTDYEDAATSSTYPQKSHVLSNRLTSILSTSFADGEIREALRILDEKKIENSQEARRWFRLDAQKEVIECNGDVIKDFGQVAEVRG